MHNEAGGEKKVVESDWNKIARHPCRTVQRDDFHRRGFRLDYANNKNSSCLKVFIATSRHVTSHHTRASRSVFNFHRPVCARFEKIMWVALKYWSMLKQAFAFSGKVYVPLNFAPTEKKSTIRSKKDYLEPFPKEVNLIHSKF